MRVLLGILLVMGLAQHALAQQLQIKTPEGNVEVNVNPGMGFGPAGGCQRYPTCGNCVMSVTNACGWCVQSGQCVPREDGACGDEQMAMASTQCPLPGARGPQRGGRGGVTIVMPGAPAAEPPAPAGMDDGAFQALVEAIKEEGFEASKLNVLESAAQENSFTVRQAGTILDLFGFSDGKLKALRSMRTRLVDRQNVFQIYKHFSFKADQDKARKILDGR